MVESGTTIRKGPLSFSMLRSVCSSASVCAVLPSPISSPRITLRPRYQLSRSQLRPASWYSRSIRSPEPADGKTGDSSSLAQPVTSAGASSSSSLSGRASASACSPDSAYAGSSSSSPARRLRPVGRDPSPAATGGCCALRLPGRESPPSPSASASTSISSSSAGGTSPGMCSSSPTSHPSSGDFHTQLGRSSLYGTQMRSLSPGDTTK
mmetsp:Transcript_9651/g.32056  ORF Transcript_9651/g.32056 Transcript_9651/m.32056 type:complete len:209 (-) Transcript_9651:2847-3473(-)